MDLNAINFQTGDLLLFSENTNIFSRLIEYFTHSKYSHTAIILQNPTYIDPKNHFHYHLHHASKQPIHQA